MERLLIKTANLNYGGSKARVPRFTAWTGAEAEKMSAGAHTERVAYINSAWT